MKKYTLSLETLNDTSEFFECLEVIDSRLPGVIKLDQFTQTRMDSSESIDYQSKVNLVSIWREHFPEGKDIDYIHNQIFSMDKGLHGTNNLKQNRLINEFSLTQEEIRKIDTSLNISKLVNKGYLIEINPITLTQRQKEIIIAIIDEIDGEIPKGSDTYQLTPDFSFIQEELDLVKEKIRE